MIPRTGEPVVALVPPSCCGAGYFRPLRRALAGRVTVRAVELPGHGRRYQETRLTDAAPAVRDLAGQIGGPVDAVYGESLGAYLGLAVADAAGARLLLAASNSPPADHEPIDTVGVVSVATAVAAFTALGGRVPPEVMADAEVAGQVYPLLRDDLLLSRSALEAVRAVRVRADIQALGGVDDTALTDLAGWAAHTLGRCGVVRLPGDHLLSRANPAGVAEVIVRAVRPR